MTFRDLFNVIEKYGTGLKGEADVNEFCKLNPCDFGGSCFDCEWGCGIDLTCIPERFRQILYYEDRIEWYRPNILGLNLTTIPKGILTIDRIACVYDGSLFQAGDYYEDVIFISGTSAKGQKVRFLFNDIGVDSNIVPIVEYSRIADMVKVAAEEAENKNTQTEQAEQTKKPVPSSTDPDDLPF